MLSLNASLFTPGQLQTLRKIPREPGLDRIMVEQEVSGRPPKDRFDQFRMVSYLALQNTK